MERGSEDPKYQEKAEMANTQWTPSNDAELESEEDLDEWWSEGESRPMSPEEILLDLSELGGEWLEA